MYRLVCVLDCEVNVCLLRVGEVGQPQIQTSPLPLPQLLGLARFHVASLGHGSDVAFSAQWSRLCLYLAHRAWLRGLW